MSSSPLIPIWAFLLVRPAFSKPSPPWAMYLPLSLLSLHLYLPSWWFFILACCTTYHFYPTSTAPPPGSGPALRHAPHAPAGQPVSSRVKGLRPLPSPSFLPPASAAAAATPQPESELQWCLLRGPGTSTYTSSSSIPATASDPGAGAASGTTPAASKHRRTAPRPTGGPAHASGPQIHRQLRRLLLSLSAVQWTELRDQPLPGLAWLLGLVRLWWWGGGGGRERVCVCECERDYLCKRSTAD